MIMFETSLYPRTSVLMCWPSWQCVWFPGSMWPAWVINDPPAALFHSAHNNLLALLCIMAVTWLSSQQLCGNKVSGLWSWLVSPKYKLMGSRKKTQYIAIKLQSYFSFCTNLSTGVALYIFNHIIHSSCLIWISCWYSTIVLVLWQTLVLKIEYALPDIEKSNKNPEQLHHIFYHWCPDSVVILCVQHLAMVIRLCTCLC